MSFLFLLGHSFRPTIPPHPKGGPLRPSGLYFIQPDDKLPSIEETPYEAEDALQSLLERHPELLPGDQISPDTPRRWLLIQREAPVPVKGDQSDFSLDHLFLDQDGTPTLVEVKRSTAPRIRREVMARCWITPPAFCPYWRHEQYATDGHCPHCGAEVSLVCMTPEERKAASVAIRLVSIMILVLLVVSGWAPAKLAVAVPAPTSAPAATSAPQATYVEQGPRSFPSGKRHAVV